MTAGQIQSRFNVTGVQVVESDDGLTKIVIRNTAASAEIYVHGATVTQYQPAGQQPVLFVSAESLFQPERPIRGGVPICWPWFGPKWDDPKAAQHGLVRAKTWDVEDIRATNPDTTEVVLTTHAGNLRATYTISVGKSLRLELQSRNAGKEPARLEQALHTYFLVGDSQKVTIDGLAGATFIDKVAGGEKKRQGRDPIRFTAETDRVYLNTEATCVLNDPVMNRRITVAKSGSRSTVVWNPWINKAAALADFGDDEWKRMCCIESANTADNHVMLSPGQTHSVSTTISVQGN